MLSVTEPAFAKINLFLDVGRAREDGFHTVKSVMHAVSLCDEVTVTLDKNKSGILVKCLGDTRLPTDSRNLAFRAAELMLGRLGISVGVQITLKKNIPVSAGLAGGSTDAAATLRALNRLLARPMSRSALSTLGAELGSDVPFCLCGTTAMCEGRGEIVTPLPHKSFNLVVAKTSDTVSTKAAYALLDVYYDGFKSGSLPDAKQYLDELISYIKGGAMPERLYNAFEPAILPTLPRTAALRERIASLGARYCLMSGSGPSVFGIFDTEQGAAECARALCREGIFATACKSAER